jgi:hypothetical protein
MNTDDILDYAACDIGYFARYILRCDSDLYHAKQSVYGDLHPGQIEWLKNTCASEYDEMKNIAVWKSRYNLLHAGNRFGKGDVQAVKFLWLHFRWWRFGQSEDSMSVNTGLTVEQALVVFEKVIKLAENSDKFVGLFFDPKNDVVYSPQPEIRFSSGSVMRARSYKDKGKRLEGDAYRYINVDECALEQYLLQLHEDIFPQRIGDYEDGQVDYIAAPKGHTAFWKLKNLLERRGFYTQEGALVTGADFEKKTYSSIVNPYISKNYLDEAFRNWSQDKIRQSVLGQFVDSSTMMFASRTAKLFDDDFVLEEPKQGHSYIDAWDLARGRKTQANDKTVGFTIDITTKPWHIVAVESVQLPWTEQSRENVNERENASFKNSIEGRIRRRQSIYGSKVYLDSTGVGDTLWEILSDIAEPVDFRGGNKLRLLEKLQAVIDLDWLKSPYIGELDDQMSGYELRDTNLETDYLMALAVFCEWVELEEKENVEAVRKVQ